MTITFNDKNKEPVWGVKYIVVFTSYIIVHFETVHEKQIELPLDCIAGIMS